VAFLLAGKIDAAQWIAFVEWIVGLYMAGQRGRHRRRGDQAVTLPTFADAVLEARARAATRLGAFWIAWRYVLILLVLLGLSLWGNLHQYVAGKTAPLREDLKQATDTLATVQQLAVDCAQGPRRPRHRPGRHQRPRQAWANAYGAVAARHPLGANCAPGKERMDLVNKDADP
jgi:hypothetical protein